MILMYQLLSRARGKATTLTAKFAESPQHTAYPDLLDLVERVALQNDPVGEHCNSYSLLSQ